MSDKTRSEIVDEILSEPRSRGSFLKGAAVAAAAAGLAPVAASAAPLEKLTARRRMMESPQTIINIAATAEAAAVTALYNVHLAVGANRLNLSGVQVAPAVLVSIVRAALREEQDHLAFLMGAGARPLYTSFTFPPQIFTRAVTTLEFFEEAETVFIAAYMAATRDFARGGMAKLAQYTYQIGGTEAEHRTLMRAGLGQLPPNNKSFETNMFQRVAGAANVLAGLGVFRPGLPYPGAAAVNRLLSTTVTRDVNAGVIQHRP